MTELQREVKVCGGYEGGGVWDNDEVCEMKWGGKLEKQASEKRVRC